MNEQRKDVTALPIAISFKKFLVAYHNHDSEMITKALEELNSYSEQERQALGQVLEEIHAEAQTAKQEGTIDALSEKYTADIEASVRH